MPPAEYDPAAYGEAWSGIYDVLYEGRDEADVVVAALDRISAGRSVLEMGVGTGRLAIPLFDAGWHVVGVESSASMVTELRRQADARSIPVHQGDMRSVRLGETFDVVLLAFSTLFLLPDQDAQIECLGTAATHLASSGRVVIETFIPDHTRWTDGRRLALSRWMADGIEIEAARHDRAAQTIEVRYLSIGAQPGVRPLRLRYAWPSEIDLMARLAGLDLLERWGGWSGKSFDAMSPGQVSVYGPAASRETAQGGDPRS